MNEDISILSVTGKKVKHRENFIRDNLLFCNYSGSFDDFSVQIQESKKFSLELTENLLKMRD